jgi:hypothetical protein
MRYQHSMDPQLLDAECVTEVEARSLFPEAFEDGMSGSFAITEKGVLVAFERNDDLVAYSMLHPVPIRYSMLFNMRTWQPLERNWLPWLDLEVA